MDKMVIANYYKNIPQKYKDEGYITVSTNCKCSLPKLRGVAVKKENITYLDGWSSGRYTHMVKQYLKRCIERGEEK